MTGSGSAPLHLRTTTLVRVFWAYDVLFLMTKDYFALSYKKYLKSEIGFNEVTNQPSLREHAMK